MVFGIRQRGDAGHHGVQRTGQARDGAGDHERLQLQQLEVVADGARALLVVSHGQQGAAEHRGRHLLQKPEGHQEHHGHEAVVLPRRGERPEREAAHGEGRTRNVHQAVVAAREAGHRVGEKVEHLREGERQHHEVGAALPDGDPAHQRRAHRARHHGERQGQRHGQGPAREREGDGVAAQPEEDALPEGEQPRVPQQQVAAHGR